MESSQKLQVQSLRILICEDNEEVCKLYDKVLRNRGHQVEITKNGEDCIKSYLSKVDEYSKDSPPFDLILLDYALPEKNGVEVAQEIMEQVPSQRVAFSSAYTDKLINELQRINMNAGIYPKFASLQSFLDFVERK